MKFLENLDFFKPLGKGLSEADTFMRREMPFNMSWGFPAALIAAYFGGPAAMNAMGSTGQGAGAATGNSMLSSLGVDGGGSFIPTAGNSFDLPSSAFTPEYLNQLAAQQGVSQGEPSFFQNLIGNNEQGLYDQFNASAAAPSGLNNNMMARQLMSMGGGQSSGGQATVPNMNIPRQQQFVFVPEAKDIQDKDMDLKKLAMVLRNDYGTA